MVCRSNVNSAVIETQRAAATAVTRPGSLRNASVRSKVTQAGEENVSQRKEGETDEKRQVSQSVRHSMNPRGGGGGGGGG